MQLDSPPRFIRPDDFEIIEQIPGVVCVARDEQLRLFWCNSAFFRLMKADQPAQAMKGSTLHDILPKGAADERSNIQRQVIDTQTPNRHYVFNQDIRVLSTIFPLDEQAFGHKGVLSITKDAPIDSRLGSDHEIELLSTPNLADLNALTSRELEVLHHVAKSMSTQQIATTLSRSSKTIDNHINSIHSKLKTKSRSQLVRYSCERGIQSFSDDEWTSIIKGSKMAYKDIKS